MPNYGPNYEFKKWWVGIRLIIEEDIEKMDDALNHEPCPEGHNITIFFYTLDAALSTQTVDRLTMDLKIKKVHIVCIQSFPRKGIEQDQIIRSFKSNGFSLARTNIDAAYDRAAIFYNSSIKVDMVKLTNIHFSNSRQLAYIQTGYFSHLGVSFSVSTCELERDGTGGGYRRLQIKEIDNLSPQTSDEKTDETGVAVPLDRTSTVCCVNTNTPSWQEGMQSITPSKDWLDAWREKGNSNNEYTIRGDRMDRIWYRDTYCKNFQLYEIEGSQRKAILTEFYLL